jgi:SAM-dependent methyltransferase
VEIRTTTSDPSLPLQVIDEELSFWERVALTRWGKYVTRLEERMILRTESSITEPRRVLDFGCGEGRWTKLLTERGWQAICTDLDWKALAKCQKRNPSAQCILARGSETSLPVVSGSLGMILCIEVRGVLQSAWFVPETLRALSPGGVLCGVFHNRMSPRGFLRSCLDRRSRLPSFYLMAYNRWRNNLLRQGFEIVHEEGLCWFPFSRYSDSWLVPICVSLERAAQLHRLPKLSPWVAFAARKRG